MSEIIYGVGFGLAVGVVVLLFFGLLIGIGELIEWYEKRNKK
tara:strand:- start:1075 stop:1200 length:126 start_codon:yes stop_codon:yes gene_type:complete